MECNGGEDEGGRHPGNSGTSDAATADLVDDGQSDECENKTAEAECESMSREKTYERLTS